jgi:hypothetical protein
MSTSTDNFTIRLIRELYTESKTTDDTITIEPMTGYETDFKISMTTAGCQVDDSKPKHVSMKYMTADEVYYYLQSLLTLLPLDEDKYAAVQIDMPLMPSVLVRVKNIHTIIHHVLYHFYFIKDNWPSKTIERFRIRNSVAMSMFNTAPSLESPPAGARRHIFFDEDGGVSHVKTTFYE